MAPLMNFVGRKLVDLYELDLEGVGKSQEQEGDFC